jgi:hypothetical protein
VSATERGLAGLIPADAQDDQSGAGNFH